MSYIDVQDLILS